MTKSYSKDPRVDRSLRYSLRDGVAHSVMAGGLETYFPALAIYLKASAGQVAILASLPQLLASAAQLLSAWLGHLTGWRKSLIVAGAVLQGLVLVPMVTVPMLYRDQAWHWLLVFVTLYYVAGSFVAPQWTSLMGDLVPERRRSRYFARRTRLTTLSAACALVGAGVGLHFFDVRAQTAVGYVVLFVVGFAARMVSTWFLARMHDPRHHTHDADIHIDRNWWKAMRHTGVLQFTLYFVLVQFSVAIAAPLFSVYMLSELKFSYLEFMANTGTAVLIQFLTLNNWGRIGDVFGNRLVLKVTGILIPFLPLAWVVSPGFWWLIAVQIAAGLAWGGFSLSANNLLYEYVPSMHRASYTAFHNVATATAVFLGALVGASMVQLLPPIHTLLHDHSPPRTALLSVFLLSGALRAVVVVTMWRRIREVRPPRRRISTRTFVFRATRFNAFSGLWYEFVTFFRERGRRGEGRPPLDQR